MSIYFVIDGPSNIPLDVFFGFIVLFVAQRCGGWSTLGFVVLSLKLAVALFSLFVELSFDFLIKFIYTGFVMSLVWLSIFLD